MTIPAGTHFGRYEIRSPIGAGGMGEVYLAHDAQLDRPVALKLLPANVTEDEDRLRRFQQEARATSALNHPNILTIYEIGLAEGTHFIATEFIDGITLRDQMARSRMKIDDVLEVSLQVASALAAAHEARSRLGRTLDPCQLIRSTVAILDTAAGYSVWGGFSSCAMRRSRA